MAGLRMALPGLEVMPPAQDDSPTAGSSAWKLYWLTFKERGHAQPH